MDDSPVAERDDADAAQLSEASTSAAMEAEAPGSASPDWPASPLDEICESAWDAVTSKAHGCDDGSTAEGAPTSAVKPRRKGAPARSGCVAIDCEMVGVGRCRSRSILARVAVVDEDGTCLLAAFSASPRIREVAQRVEDDADGTGDLP